MAERPTYRDIAAALKAAKEAGVTLRRIEVRKDAVVLIPGEPETTDSDEDPEIAAINEAVRNAKV